MSVNEEYHQLRLLYGPPGPLPYLTLPLFTFLAFRLVTDTRVTIKTKVGTNYLGTIHLYTSHYTLYPWFHIHPCTMGWSMPLARPLRGMRDARSLPASGPEWSKS